MAAVANSHPPSRRSWANTNSKQMLKAYDKSPVHSPPISRNNSVTSIGSVDSTRSEPTWHRQSQSSAYSDRRESNASQTSANTTASHKKSGLKGIFGRHKDPAEKEKKKQHVEKIVLGSKHAAAVKTKLMMDPKYKEINEQHRKDSLVTAGITPHKSAHSTAAEQEARHPHSGPPAVHGSLDLPGLTRIESHDDPDDEVDYYEHQRREWDEAIDKMGAIPEIRSRTASRVASPWASPAVSRESSPNRGDNVMRPALGSKRNSWAGGYRKDDSTGRWRKTPPGTTPPSMTPVMPNPSEMNPDLLARSLAERLNTHA